MIQVHCLDLKIAVLDRPYWVYYRIRVLETFTILLTPLESLEMLENFVSCWLRLQQYIENLEREKAKLRDANYFQPRIPRSETPTVMSIDDLKTPDTPNSTNRYDLQKPQHR